MDRRRIPAWVVLAIASGVPAVVSAVLAAAGDWATTIDNAVIAVRTYDTFGTDLPLVGIYFSLTGFARSAVRLHHLGPLQFWTLAVPLRLGGPSGVGLVFGAAAVNALAAAGSVWAAHRLAGTRLAAVTAGAVALLAWSLGGQVLHDPWNAHLALLPFLFFLVAGSAVAAGHVGLLPVTAFAASFLVQTHATYLAPVALTVVWMAAGVVHAIRAAPDAAAVRRRVIRPLVATAVVTALCWAGPLVDQLSGTHNATNVARAAMSGNYERVGLDLAWRDLVHATSVPPIWLEPFTGVIKPVTAPSGLAIATALTVLGALIAATGWSAVRGFRTQLALCTTAIVATAATFASTLRQPLEFHAAGFLYPRRVWWVLGVVIWLALVHVATSLVAARRPARSAGGRSGSDLPALAFGLGSLAVALLAVWPRLGPADDYGSAGFNPVRELGSATAGAVRGPEPWELLSTGEFAEYVVAPGIASELILRGRPVLVADRDFPDLGPRHFVDDDDPPRRRVLIVSGPEAGAPIDGYSLVGRWDPATAPARFRDYRQALLLIPIEPVAVYVSEATAAPAAS